MLAGPEYESNVRNERAGEALFAMLSQTPRTQCMESAEFESLVPVTPVSSSSQLLTESLVPVSKQLTGTKDSAESLQGCLAHKKTPPPLGTP